MLGIIAALLCGVIVSLWEIATALRGIDERLYDIESNFYKAHRDDILRQL